MPDHDPMNVETRVTPPMMRAAAPIASSFREAAEGRGATIEVTWTTGARRRTWDWDDGPIDEELVVDPSAVDMARFDAGAVPVLDNHRAGGSVRDVLGVVERGWIENGEGRALVRFSTRADVAEVVEDIRAGVLRTLSVGYSVQRYERIRPADRADGGRVPLYRATSWTPMEISIVKIAADPAAQVRSETSPAGHVCEFVSRAEPAQGNQHMNDDQQGAADAGATRSEAAPVAAPSVPAADILARAADITDICTRHGVGHLAAGLIRAGSTVDAARAAVLQELAVRDAAAGGHRNVQAVTTVQDEHQTRLEGMAEALMHRVDSRAALTDNGRRFRGMSLREMGREMLESSGVSTRGMSPMELAARTLSHRSGGMHATSDFASIAANVANKRLRAGYGENPGTYTRWARRAPNAPDFKSISVVQLSAMPDLMKVNEHGEFKYGSVTDAGETYSVITYGRMVALTRQAIINDDLRAFDRLVSGFGASAMRLENRLVYAQITANPNLADGTALFHSSRNNLSTGAGSALSLTSLATMRTAMRRQTGMAGEELNLAPAFLIVPATLEQSAYQFTSSNYVPNTPAAVNEFRSGGRTALEPIVEPILDSNSLTAWYGVAASSQVDTVEYCYLDGAEGPVVDSEVGFEVDGLTLRCRLDFAAKVVDFRGLHRAAGA